MKNKNYFDAKLIVIFLFIYFYVVPYLFFFSIETTIAFFVASLGLVFIILGKTMAVPVRMNLGAIRVSRQFIDIVCFGILLSDCFLILMYLRNKILFVEYSDSFSVVNYITLYFGIFNVIIKALKLFLFSLYIKNKRRYFLVFIVQLSLAFFSQTRMDLIEVLIIYLIYGYYLKYLRLKSYHFFGAILLSPLLFAVLLIKRGIIGKFSFEALALSVKSVFSSSDIISFMRTAMETFDSYEIYTKIVTENIISLENGFLRILFMSIPRSLWVNKPEAQSRFIASLYNKSAYINNGGVFGTLFGDMYINGSIVAVIMFSFILGVFLFTVQKNMKSSSFTQVYPVAVMFYAIVVVSYFQFFRGWMSDTYWKLIIYTLLYLMFNKLAFFRNLNTSNRNYSYENNSN